MPIICESPRESTDTNAVMELRTRVELYALEVAEVARERGFVADWGRINKAFYADVMGVSESDFSEMLEIASKRLTP